MANRINTTLSLDNDIKTRFKIECIRNETDMSSAIEDMMVQYIELSEKLHKIKDNENNDKKNS